MRKVLMGNHAVAWGARLARVEVASAYPITPQTQTVELLAEWEASGEFKGRFLRVESEHSAMAALLGAATAGARTFTATSSHGLAYMHEMLHWISGARLPVVLANVNRALAAPWSLGTDQTDSLSQRDTGWIQFYCSDNQEVLDTILMAYKVSEEVGIPSMVVLDGFILSHTYEPVEIPPQEAVDRYLPEWKPRAVLDPGSPASFGGLAPVPQYFRLRRRLAADMERAKAAIAEAGGRFGDAFGRSYDLIEGYQSEDAEALLVTSGAAGATAKAAVDSLRAEGRKAGSLRFRVFRPFPREALLEHVRPGVPLAVVDRNFSQGHHGIFCEEIKSALYAEPQAPEVHGFVAGVGGGDVTVELLKEIWLETRSGKPRSAAPVWMEDAR